jgi:hypothetical protein
MKIVISNSNSGEVYGEIEDATSSQISAYSNGDVIVIDEEELIVESKAVEYNNNILNVMVSKDENPIVSDTELSHD